MSQSSKRSVLPDDTNREGASGSLPDDSYATRAPSEGGLLGAKHESIPSIVFDGGTVIDREIARVLLIRLRNLILIFTCGWLFFYLGQVATQPLTTSFIRLALLPAGFGFFVMVSFLIFIRSRRESPLPRLRQVEVAFFLFWGGLLSWEQFRFLALDGFLTSYAHRGPMDMIILARCPVLMWFGLIVAYGTFIPNTGRRCSIVTGVLLGMALFSGSLSCLRTGISLSKGIQFMLESGLWVSIGWTFAVYGSYKISLLSQRVREAQQLGQYKLIKRLGKGGMGEVYLAEHRLMKRPCAIKLIRSDYGCNPMMLRRFEREVQVLTRLTHWNVVDVFDYGQSKDGTFYYVMEYVEGMNLEEIVRNYGPLPPARAVHILRQISDALREAHAKGLVHRDLKPSNVILGERGGVYDVAKLLDFGLVQDLRQTDDQSRITQMGSLLGTPHYMSPEQVRCVADLGPQSDIYSLGALGYWLLVGEPPFSKRTVFEVLDAHLNESVVYPSSRRSGLPNDLEAVVLNCLAKQPEERFPSMEVVEERLSGCACAGLWSSNDAKTWWTERLPPGREETLGAL
jgi:eukaryotic-like serine/threonine-protein kinase